MWPAVTCSPTSGVRSASATSSATAISRSTRLFADLGRLSGVEPPAVKLPLTVALTLSRAGQQLPGLSLPSPTEVRASSLNWAFVNAKAKRELGWKTSPHEDCLEATIAWYREREGGALAPTGARQPLVMRLVGEAVRRSPL